MALTFGLTRSICAMNACITSVAETLRVREQARELCAAENEICLGMMLSRYIRTMSNCSCV